MIVTPELKPQLIKALEVDFGTTIAEAIWKKMIDNLNWYNAQFPIGTIMFMHQTSTFADSSLLPDPTGVWQFCDGSPISDTSSPLFGVVSNVPDFKDKFLRGDNTIGTLGGTEDIDLTHNHTGFTGFHDNREDTEGRTDFGGDKNSGSDHRHGIISDLLIQPIIPKYISLQPYMKINGNMSFNDENGFPYVDNEFADFGDIMSIELAADIKVAIDKMTNVFPLGEITPIMTNIPGSVIDPNIWQQCDGSEITNENSPLRSVGGITNNTPDLLSRYLKIAANVGQVGLSQGINIFDQFAHNHGGRTQIVESVENADSTKAGASNTEFFHDHSMVGDLDGIFNMEPPFFTVKYFMKIQ